MTIVSDLINRGEGAIADMVAERREETLHLEFKTLSGDSSLNRDDRKMLAKAVCGFANAEGGAVIVGIETKRIDGVDVASGKRPIRHFDRFQRLLTAAVPEFLSPQLPGITIRSIASEAADAGYIVIDVPRSDDRPHMSVIEKRYFRRGSDGTRVLEHGEIRELMFVSREARLELNCGLRDGVSTGDLRFQLHLVLNLRNVGRVPASAPFLRLKDVGWKLGASLGPIVSQRTGAGRTFGFYASRDVILHTGDEIGLAEFETGLDFRGTAQSTAPNAVQSIRKSEVFHTFRMVNWSGMAADGIQPNDYPIQVSGVYGAENAIASSFNFEIDKAQLLDLFAAHHNY